MQEDAIRSVAGDVSHMFNVHLMIVPLARVRGSFSSFSLFSGGEAGKGRESGGSSLEPCHTKMAIKYDHPFVLNAQVLRFFPSSHLHAIDDCYGVFE